jgi:Zinc finger, C3HC4 type (RING finger)
MMPYTAESNEVIRSFKDRERKRKNAHLPKSPRRTPGPKNGKHSSAAASAGTLWSPNSPLKSSRALLASVYHAASSAPSSVASARSIPWHHEIAAAIHSHQWDAVRALIAQLQQQNHHSLSLESLDSYEKKTATKTSFWSRISGLRGGSHNASQSTLGSNEPNKTWLLSVDEEQRTPLHLLVTCRTVPTDIVAQVLNLESRAASIPNGRGRLPLHFAIVHRLEISVIALLIDAYPAAMSFPDSKGRSPLQYAVDIARRESGAGPAPPRTYWMPLPDCCDEALWQEEQTERWSVVHWLLLSSATHPHTSLSVGGRKPLLVEALLAAASPAVISLLIGASVMLLSHEKKATAFAGSTLYTCITRHYPFSILMSLTSLCPPDVHKVRDETGMGLVAAQFISGCFEQVADSQEWMVSEDFYACFNECIEVGEINDDPAVADWWRKLEFLVAFCACSQWNRSGSKSIKKKKKSEVKKRFEPTNFPSEYLLHAALVNEDTPPAVVQMILSLYPSSILLKDPKTGALPLHLIAMRRDYIPRYYEVFATGNDSTMNIVLAADRSAVFKRHDDRLPLHHAIASGRMMSSIVSILDAMASHRLNEEDITAPPPLLQKDPDTGLYPFLLAASYPNNSSEDSRRWTSVARNKYSSAAWKGLSDRGKASAVLRVAELEDIARIDTIYELLRRQPEAICTGARQSIRRFPYRKPSDKQGALSFLSRDSTGKGVVADHYISWCFTKRVDRIRGLMYDDNIPQQRTLRQAIEGLRKTGNLSSAPMEFQTWWVQLISYIRRAFREEKRNCEKSEWIAIPYEKHEYLLHVALTNSDTPPEVIEIILASNTQSASLYVPGSSLLPLHIASRTSSYTPRVFERYKESSLSLVLNAYPKAARILSNGRLPLHVAVSSGKTGHEIDILLKAEPNALSMADSKSGLFPFQLMASCSLHSSTQRAQFQHLARNKFDDKAWDDLSPQERTMHVLQAQKEHDLAVLSSIFILLRSDATSIEYSSPEIEESETQTSCLQHGISRHCTSRTLVSKSSDMSGTTTKASEDSSFLEKVKETIPPGSRTQASLPLMLLLSQHRSKTSANNDVYECDASVLSNIDVMSTLTSTNHTDKRNIARKSRFEDDASIELEGYSREKDSSIDEETSYDDFAEDSFVRSFATYSEGETSGMVEDSRNTSGADDSSVQSDEESFAIFEIRRAPRLSTKKLRDGFDGNRSAVKLTKRPAQILLGEIKTHSLSSKVGHGKPSSDGSIPSNSISKHTWRSKHGVGLKVSRPDGKGPNGGINGTETRIPTLLNSEISPVGGNNVEEHSSVSLSLPSSHQRFKPVTSLPSSASVASDKNTSGSSAKSKRSDIVKGHPTDSPGRLLQVSQASLLGSWGDLDPEDDDLLLNLGSKPHETFVRSASDHLTASKSNDVDVRLNQESYIPIRRSNSDHIQMNHSSFSFGRKRFAFSSALKTTGSMTKKDVLTDETASRLESRKSCAPDISAICNVQDTCHTDTDRAPVADSTKVTLKYFDKVSMSWKTEWVDSADTPDRCMSPHKVKYFDKASFRWVIDQPKNEICTSQDNAASANEGRGAKLQRQKVQNPFSLDMHLSKASQISKSVRHQFATTKGRSRFQGSSPTRRSQKKLANVDQMATLMSSSREFLACLLCKENERNVLLVPCRHLCLCQSCSSSNEITVTCPLCACQVNGTMLIA